MTGAAHSHLSQLAVERYLLGEIAGEARRRLEEEISACPACRRRVDATAADDRAFALRPVPASIRALATAPEPAARPWVLRWLIAVPVAAGAAAIAIVLWGGGPDGTGPADEGAGLVPGIGDRGADDAVRKKGSTSAQAGDAALALGFYVSRGGVESVGRPGERLGPGDRIQLWYDGPGAPEFALVGVDGRGAVSLYFSSRDGQGRALAAGRGLPLGSAIELDDAKGVERFFLCAGPAAAEPGAVERAARSLVEGKADLSAVERLPMACDQASVWIRKE
jgi:hypothetical protein